MIIVSKSWWKQGESQDVICERGALLEKWLNIRSVPCKCFYNKYNLFFLFFFGLQQVMLEWENHGSCRPFIQKMIFPVTPATSVQNESRWPLFLPKHRMGRLRTANVHYWLSDWLTVAWMQPSMLIWQLIDCLFSWMIVMQHLWALWSCYGRLLNDVICGLCRGTQSNQKLWSKY